MKGSDPINMRLLEGRDCYAGLDLSSTGDITALVLIFPPRESYDYIIIDCMPSLGMLTVNALAASDSVLIPVQAAYLPVKGLQQLIKTIGRVKRQLNPRYSVSAVSLRQRIIGWDL